MSEQRLGVTQPDRGWRQGIECCSQISQVPRDGTRRLGDPHKIRADIAPTGPVWRGFMRPHAGMQGLSYVLSELSESNIRTFQTDNPCPRLDVLWHGGINKLSCALIWHHASACARMNRCSGSTVQKPCVR